MSGKKLTLQQLESHLWGAADILRGKIDSSDYKHYIFGLLFYKRLCDVWEEEYEQRLAEYQDAELAADPDEHRFHIPEGAFWKDVRKHTTNIGEHLNAAFHAIEDANLRLLKVFQDVDFNKKNVSQMRPLNGCCSTLKPTASDAAMLSPTCSVTPTSI